MQNLSIVLVVLFSLNGNAQNEDALLRLFNQRSYISSLEDLERKDLILMAVSDQFYFLEKFKNKISDSIYIDLKLNAISFALQTYRIQNDTLHYFKLFGEFEHIISKSIPLGNWVRYAYLYELYWKCLLHENNITKAFNILEQAEQVVLTYTDKGAREHRLSQISKYKAGIYEKELNFTLAKRELKQGLYHAQKADEAYTNDYKKSWGFTSGLLAPLLRMAAITNDVTLIKEYLEELIKSKSDYYGKTRTKEILLTLFSQKDISSEHLAFILNQIGKFNEFKNDYDLNILAANYFLDQSETRKASKYLTHVYQISKSKVRPDYYLLLAHSNLYQKNYYAFNANLNQWLHLSGVGDQHRDWSTSTQRHKILKQVIQAVQYYEEAFKQTCKLEYLYQISILTDLAIKGIQYIKTKINTDEDRISLLADMTSFTNKALKNYYTLSQYDKEYKVDGNIVLQYFEINKSFNLYFNRALTLEKYTELDLNKKQRLERVISQTEFEINFKSSSNDSLHSLYDSLNAEYIKLISNYEFKYEPISIKQVQSNLTADASLIEYFTNGSNVFVFVINKNDYIFKELNTKKGSDLFKSLAYFESLNKLLPDEYTDENKGKYKELLYDLYSILLVPVETDIKSKITIVANGQLSTLPWNALLTSPANGNNPIYWDYLIKEKSINTQQSAQLWLSSLKNINRDFKYELLAIAPSFSNLRFNKAEAQSIGHMFSFSKVFTDEKATNSKFYKYAAESKLIHVASHAKSDEDGGSRILMSNDTITSDDLKSMKVQADLLFLSACETGSGKIIEAEGVLSLANSFFRSGVQSVISTLWAIDDKVSKDQVLDVYKRLLSGQSKEEAIRGMQLDYIKNA